MKLANPFLYSGFKKAYADEIMNEFLNEKSSKTKEMLIWSEKLLHILHSQTSYIMVGISLLVFSILLAIKLDNTESMTWLSVFAPMAVFDIFWLVFHFTAVINPELVRQRKKGSLPKVIEDYYFYYGKCSGNVCGRTFYSLACLISAFSGVGSTILIPFHLQYKNIGLNTVSAVFVIFVFSFSFFTFPMIGYSWKTRSYCPAFSTAVYAVAPIMMSILISVIIYVSNIRYYLYLLIPAFVVDGSLLLIACGLCCVSMKCAKCSVIVGILVPVAIFEVLLCRKLAFDVNTITFVQMFIPIWVGAFLIGVGSYIWYNFMDEEDD
jgi:hypothetical protein